MYSASIILDKPCTGGIRSALYREARPRSPETLRKMHSKCHVQESSGAGTSYNNSLCRVDTNLVIMSTRQGIHLCHFRGFNMQGTICIVYADKFVASLQITCQSASMKCSSAWKSAGLDGSGITTSHVPVARLAVSPVVVMLSFRRGQVLRIMWLQYQRALL